MPGRTAPAPVTGHGAAAGTEETGKRAVRAVPAWRRSLRPYLLIVPALLLTGGILYPFGLGLYYTVFDFAASKPQPDLVGLGNYRRILTQPAFWDSARVTVAYAVGAAAVETVLGVAVALLLHRSSLVGRVLEKILILPLMIAPVIAAIMWKLMLQPSVGVINHLLEPFGLGGVQWTDTPTGALLSSITVDMWVYTPFVAILALAGLRSLPASPFEAAAVDGAGWWFTFRRLTLPMLWPYVLVAVIFRFMDSLKVFDIIYALTEGGPGDSTMVLQIRAYLEAIRFQRYSFGISYMIVLWAVVYLVTMVLVRYLGRIQNRAAEVPR
ncbi:MULTISPECIES: sugar ABC transporter permease [unclassified Streptomyces]|uniref:carbohydrate ABC transporter permease n=1 Tax=unclassified Streptomyces TaxID=2593676 RepID=UPI002E762813|nr:sugar ABC transporter permease [Streptomyces sp. JV190]MEE1843467.1 sugar ABC transporter permease [Streptomyces sp. JV190]